MSVQPWLLNRKGNLMVSINTTGSGHLGPAANSGFQWLPYPDAGRLKTLQQALDILDSRVKVHRPCNTAFARLPGGRTFREVFEDATVFISFDPQRRQNVFGATLVNEVTITDFSIAMGRWTTAATLVHELAHVDGAPGGNDHRAEHTLVHCLLAGLHDPTIVGQLLQQERPTDVSPTVWA